MGAAEEANRLNEENARLRDEIDRVLRERDEAHAKIDELRGQYQYSVGLSMALEERDQARSERDEARREADRFRHGCTVEGDFVCPMELSAMAATMARESLEATIRFELHALPEESPLDACRRVYAERDEARADLEDYRARNEVMRIMLERCATERDEVRAERDSAKLTATAATMAHDTIEKMVRFELRVGPEDSLHTAVQRVRYERDEARATIGQIRRVFGNALAFDDARGDVVKMAEIAYRGACEGDKASGQLRDMTRQRDEARAEVERWKRSCNVFRERDWPKAFQATVTSLEREVSDAYEQLAKLRKLSKPWEGDAYRRGVESMRKAAVSWLENNYASIDAEYIGALPIPEEPT